MADTQDKYAKANDDIKSGLDEKVAKPDDYVVSTSIPKRSKLQDKVLVKHQDTKWEKFRNFFPKSSDDEYKRFNPYDIMMNSLEKIANSGKGLDDMFIDLMMAMVCMPLDQIKAVCDFRRRKAQEKKNGKKADKDFDKLSSVLNLGYSVDGETNDKILKAKVKNIGYEFSDREVNTEIKTANEQVKKEADLLRKAMEHPDEMTKEERKEALDAFVKNMDEMDISQFAGNHELMSTFVGLTNEVGRDRVADVFGVKRDAYSDTESLLKVLGKAVEGKPNAADFVEENLSKYLEEIAKQEVESQKRVKSAELSETIADMQSLKADGKTAEYSEEKLSEVLTEFGFDAKKTKADGQLNFDTVLRTLQKAKLDMERANISEAQKARAQAKQPQTKTAAPQKKTTMTPQQMAAARKRSGNSM